MIPARPAVDVPVEEQTVVIVEPGRLWFWLLAKLPVWVELSREEAAQCMLQREVKVRYTPLIVEMDRKTILNEVQ